MHLVSIIFTLAFNASCAFAGTANLSTSIQMEEKEGQVKINGTSLFVREVGPRSAPVLIVLHGGPGGNYLSQRPLEQLAPQFRVVLYDQRGTGKSKRLKVSIKNPSSMNQLTLKKNVQDLEKLRQYLKVDKINLIGHSFGGALAAFYAATYPNRVNKLIVYSGGPEDLELAESKKRKHLSLLSSSEKSEFKHQLKVLGDSIDKSVSQEMLDLEFVKLVKLMLPSLNCRPAPSLVEVGRGGFWANQVVGKYVGTFDRYTFSQKLKMLKSPTLLIWGRCEPSPLGRLLYLLDNIQNSKLVIFENSGHNAMEEESELFFDTLISFLTSKTIQQRTFKTRKDILSDPNYKNFLKAD